MLEVVQDKCQDASGLCHDVAASTGKADSGATTRTPVEGVAATQTWVFSAASSPDTSDAVPFADCLSPASTVCSSSSLPVSQQRCLNKCSHSWLLHRCGRKECGRVRERSNETSSESFEQWGKLRLCYGLVELRLIIVATYICITMLTGITFWGWAEGLRDLLFRDGAYSWVCAHQHDQLDRSVSYQSASSSRRGASGGIGQPLCADQEVAVNNLLTYAAAANMVLGGVAGACLDIFGPWFTAMLGTLMKAFGWVLLAVSGPHLPAYVPAFIFIGGSSDYTYLPVLATGASLFKRKGIVMSLLGAGNSLAAIVPVCMYQSALALESPRSQHDDFGSPPPLKSQKALTPTFQQICFAYVGIAILSYVIVAFFLLPKGRTHFCASPAKVVVVVDDDGGGGEVGRQGEKTETEREEEEEAMPLPSRSCILSDDRKKTAQMESHDSTNAMALRSVDLEAKKKEREIVVSPANLRPYVYVVYPEDLPFCSSSRKPETAQLAGTSYPAAGRSLPGEHEKTDTRLRRYSSLPTSHRRGSEAFFVDSGENRDDSGENPESSLKSTDTSVGHCCCPNESDVRADAGKTRSTPLSKTARPSCISAVQISRNYNHDCDDLQRRLCRTSAFKTTRIAALVVAVRELTNKLLHAGSATDFWSYFFSARYLLIIPYVAILLLRVLFVAKSAPHQLGPQADSLWGFLRPLTFIPCIGFGVLTDFAGIFVTLFIVNLSGMLVYLFVLGEAVACKYLALASLFVYSSYCMMSLYTYLQITHPPYHFGKLCGIASTAAGLSPPSTYVHTYLLHPKTTHLLGMCSPLQKPVSTDSESPLLTPKPDASESASVSAFREHSCACDSAAAVHRRRPLRVL